MWMRCWLGIAVICLTTGCIRETSSPNPNEASDPRIISLSPSNTELLYAIGAGDLLVGRTSYCDHPPAAEAVPAVGSLFPPDFERILSARPTLIVMSDGNQKVRERLERLKLSVVVIHPRTVDDIADSMRQLGRAVGRETQANQAAKAFEAQLKGLSKLGASKTPVLYEVSPEPIRIPGQKTFLADLIRHAGGKPVGSDDQGDWPMVDQEWVLHADPAVILVSDNARRESLLGTTTPLRTLRAVREKNVYAVPDSDLFVRPGPRVLEAIQWLSRTLNARSR